MKKILITVGLLVALALPLLAATAPGVLPASSVPDINTQNSLTNATTAFGTGTWGGTNMTLATNGLYPASIAGGFVVTNFVWLNNPQSGNIIGSGNSLNIGLSATASGVNILPGTFGGVTNVQFVLYSSVAPLILVTNAVGAMVTTSNSPQPVYFTTLALGFNSVTNTAAQTNFTYWLGSTLQWHGAQRLYLGAINAFVTNTAYVTNIQVYVNQN